MRSHAKNELQIIFGVMSMKNCYLAMAVYGFQFVSCDKDWME